MADLVELASKRNLSLGWGCVTCWRLAGVGLASCVLTAFPPCLRPGQRSILPWVTCSSGTPSSAPRFKEAIATEGGLVPPVVMGVRGDLFYLVWFSTCLLGCLVAVRLRSGSCG